MQDSFDARMQGQTPETVRPKSKKGWMICSIVLIFILVGVCVFGGMIIMKGDRDTNRLAEVEQQLKEKDDKIAELEKKIEDLSVSSDGETDGDGQDSDGEIDDEKTVKAELEAYIKSTKMTDSSHKYTYTINKLSLTKDQKYYFAHVTVTIDGGANESSLEYRLAKGGKWTFANGGQAVEPCSTLGQEALDFIKTYGKEVKVYAACSDSKGNTIDYSK